MSRSDRRATLLAHNAGLWEGHLLRLEAAGAAEAVERERFPCRLRVEERDGLVEAALTNLSSGNVRSMSFTEPPPEMQIHPDGHWSLGPDRIGPWPWVSELCLKVGDRRRRAVVRLEGDRLISLALLIEARPGFPQLLPAPLRLQRQRREGGWLWSASDDLELQVAAGWVELAWQAQVGLWWRLRRAYSEHGLLQPLAPAQDS